MGVECFSAVLNVSAAASGHLCHAAARHRCANTVGGADAYHSRLHRCICMRSSTVAGRMQTILAEAQKRPQGEKKATRSCAFHESAEECKVGVVRVGWACRCACNPVMIWAALSCWGGQDGWLLQCCSLIFSVSADPGSHATPRYPPHHTQALQQPLMISTP